MSNRSEPFSRSSRLLFCTSNRSKPLSPASPRCSLRPMGASQSSRPLYSLSNRSKPISRSSRPLVVRKPLSRSSRPLVVYVQWEPIAQLFLPPPLLFVQWDRAAQPGGSRLEVGLRQAGCSQAEALLGGVGGGGARGPRAPGAVAFPLQPLRLSGSGRPRTRGRLFDQHIFFNWLPAPQGVGIATQAGLRLHLR
ncbi:unnamed protein product [Arctogadus glacialis]